MPAPNLSEEGTGWRDSVPQSAAGGGGELKQRPRRLSPRPACPRLPPPSPRVSFLAAAAGVVENTPRPSRSRK